MGLITYHIQMMRVPSLCNESWVALDFETATRERNSACAIGLAFGRRTEIIGTAFALIKPPGNKFEEFHSSLHGIDASTVERERTFPEIWPELVAAFSEVIVLAHNASFDIGVLRSCLDAYGLAYPSIQYYCTVDFARKMWPTLRNHKLSTVAEHLEIDFKHHDAEEDASVCAMVVIECMKITGLEGIKLLTKALEVKARYIC
jgi:DNA polymerase-3 subunit epsilon